MSEPQPDPVRGFFGAALMAVGVLAMLLCGGCGAVFFLVFLVDALTHNARDLEMVVMPIVLGGVPALVGFGLFAAGRSLRRSSDAAKPPPSGPPPG